jgi:O-antigen/teichoic acid export membrane protein
LSIAGGDKISKKFGTKLMTLRVVFQALAILAFIFIYHRPKLIPDLSFLKTLNLKEILKFGFVLWFIALAGFALKTLDMVLLGKYVPLALVGIYSVCAFIPLVIGLIILGILVSQKVMSNNTEALKLTVIIILNTVYELFLVLLLAYGLFEVPRGLWTNCGVADKLWSCALFVDLFAEGFPF